MESLDLGITGFIRQLATPAQIRECESMDEVYPMGWDSEILEPAIQANPVGNPKKRDIGASKAHKRARDRVNSKNYSVREKRKTIELKRIIEQKEVELEELKRDNKALLGSLNLQNSNWIDEIKNRVSRSYKDELETKEQVIRKLEVERLEMEQIGWDSNLNPSTIASRKCRAKTRIEILKLDLQILNLDVEIEKEVEIGMELKRNVSNSECEQNLSPCHERDSANQSQRTIIMERRFYQTPIQAQDQGEEGAEWCLVEEHA